jgi:MoaA/NifB/PqqE/SkfB family radical SAM enzyme
MISTNLNIKKKNLEEVIRSGPDEIKISLSGFAQEFYSKTHVKGNIELVKQNMELVRDLVNRFKLPTKTWVGHHLYRHNMHESAAIMGLCRRLDFEYRPMHAFYQPLEKMVDLIEGKASATETDLLANFTMHPLEVLALKRKTLDKDLDCESRFNITAINYDGSVALCCGTYDEQNMLGVNFVDTAHDDIQALKYRHPFCKKCYDYGLQYSYRPMAAQR